MKILIAKNYEHMSHMAAKYISGLITLHPRSVLGLATGSTPIGTYRELIRQHREEGLSFDQVVTFNLDEYVGLVADHPQSYRYFMKQNLFDHIDIRQEAIHIPSGSVDDLNMECRLYDDKISEAGGIDLQLLGIGRNGHIGFNEPSDTFESGTHVVELEEQTIQDNSRFFETVEEVPVKAISVGMKTILQARRVVVLASGIEKAEAVKEMVEGAITPSLPASILQLHPDVTLIADEAAASLLKEKR